MKRLIFTLSISLLTTCFLFSEDSPELEPVTMEEIPSLESFAADTLEQAATETSETEAENPQDDESFEENNEEEKPVRISLGIVPDEILDRPEVEKFRKQYLTGKWSKLLYSYLESAMEYRLYVRKAIQEKEMPEILEYLPVVESNYKTNAKSKSGAIGMWQFMANSVWPFLTLNDFVDERLDPWKSTDAALRKLTDNYNYFNDWLIAIASYNCGVGAMNKVLRKAEEKDFWYLVDHKLLPQQTADYVPKLIAIADLAINSDYYGMKFLRMKKMEILIT